MTTLLDPNVGKVFVPEMDALTFGPAFPTGRRHPYVGIVSYTAKPGPVLDDDGHLIWPTPKPGLMQKGWGLAVLQLAGLAQKWRESEQIQRYYRTAEAFIAAVRTGRVNPLAMGWATVQWTHNERIQNGGRMVAKGFWGYSSASPTQSTVGVPSWIALNNNSAFTSGNFTWAHDGTDQSLGNGSSAVGANVSTNEYTTAGLGRANGTLSGFVDMTSLDGQFQLQDQNTFTCTSGPQSVYGAGLVDASSTAAFNLYAEAPFATATLQTNDTLQVTWTIKD